MFENEKLGKEMMNGMQIDSSLLFLAQIQLIIYFKLQKSADFKFLSSTLKYLTGMSNSAASRKVLIFFFLWIFISILPQKRMEILKKYRKTFLRN